MNILVVDYKTPALKALLKSLNQHQVSVVSQQEFGSLEAVGNKVVIFTGNFPNQHLSVRKRFSQEKKFIESWAGGVIGIGWGMELISEVYGINLDVVASQSNNAVELETRLPLIHSNFLVNLELHWQIKRLPTTWETRIKTCQNILYFAHRTRPLTGYNMLMSWVDKTTLNTLISNSLEKMQD